MLVSYKWFKTPEMSCNNIQSSYLTVHKQNGALWADAILVEKQLELNLEIEVDNSNVDVFEWRKMYYLNENALIDGCIIFFFVNIVPFNNNKYDRNIHFSIVNPS